MTALRVAFGVALAFSAVWLGWERERDERTRRRLLAVAAIALALTVATGPPWIVIAAVASGVVVLLLRWNRSLAVRVRRRAPACIRGGFRAREEQRNRGSLERLLGAHRSEEVSAEACRYVVAVLRASGAFIALGERVVASERMSERTAARIWSQVRSRDQVIVSLLPPDGDAIIVPLVDRLGHVLVVTAGTERCLDDEDVAWCSSFARIVGAVLARDSLAAELAAHQAGQIALDETKDALLTAVSHDLRTPLTAIEGLAETLAERSAAIPPAERRDMLRRIVRNAHRLERLVEDLLDLDRLRRGIMEPKRTATNLGALFRTVVADADPPSTHRIHVDVGDTIAVVDAAKVERIMEALLINATRHTPPGTTVWIRAEAEATGALLIVEDDGPGIPEEDRERVFDVFHRAGGSPGGVGIGLSLVARLAELHGGRAWVADRAGGGAAIHVWLPERRAIPQPAAPSPASPAEQGARGV